MTPETDSPQGFAIELYFDAELESQVFTFRKSIYDLGVKPVLGKMGDRPHISLTVINQENPEKLKMICQNFAATLSSFPVTLESVGVFPTSSNVLYLTPIPSLRLIEVHHAFHRLLAEQQVDSKSYYLPDRWVPHCTLEFELPEEDLDLAVKLTKQHFSPLRGKCASLGLISFRPIQYLAEYELIK